MKRNNHRILRSLLFIFWVLLFILMQQFSFDWADQNELRLCIVTVGLFLLQCPIILFFQTQNNLWCIRIFAFVYGAAFIIKDVSLVLAIVRPGWHGPLALVLTCMFCDLSAFAICRRYCKEPVKRKGENSENSETGL